MDDLSLLIDAARKREELLHCLREIFAEQTAVNPRHGLEGAIEKVNIHYGPNSIQYHDSLSTLSREVGIGEKILQEGVNRSVDYMPADKPSVIVKHLANGYLLLRHQDHEVLEVFLPIVATFVVMIEQISNRNDILNSLSSALESRDLYTCGHAGRVADYAEVIARQYYKLFLKSPEDDLPGVWAGLDVDRYAGYIRDAAILHDIGKVGMDDSLTKEGSLTDSEFILFKTHVREGAKIVAKIRCMKDMQIDMIVRQHHEEWGGDGYLGHAGEDIHIGARIIAMADSLDAMTSDRVYRKSLPLDYVFDDLRANSFVNMKYDSRVFLALENALINCLLQMPATKKSFAMSATEEEWLKSITNHFNEDDYFSTDKYREKYETYPGKIFHKDDRHAFLVCNENFIAALFKREAASLTHEAFPFTVAVMDILGEQDLRGLHRLIKDEPAERKYLGHYKEHHIIVMSGRDTKHLFNLINKHNAARKPNEKIIALIDTIDQPSTYQVQLNHLINDLQCIEKDKVRVLYHGDIHPKRKKGAAENVV